ncbi:prepilin-type N-terminal cleavage/methylation domain-containing protein [candidate division KSB1 bacterium]|nr:prepilin-type N-terminal cleavage/methylation domain-containing protein [candidate division KSB1 bacterium]
MKKRCAIFKNQNGFTLIELTVVIVIVGILSYAVVANFSDSHERLQIDAITLKIASDVRYARDLALTEGRGSRVYIDLTNNQYYLKWDDESYMQNPLGGGDFVVQLGRPGEFGAVQITSTAFSGGRLDFGTSGSPRNAGNSFSGELILVSINNEKKVVITANTGFVRIENL